MKTAIRAFAFLSLAAQGALAEPAVNRTCPALDASNRAFALDPAPVKPDFVGLTGDPALADANVASAIVHHFEGGGANAYTNISERDRISIGRSQWNAGSGSLFSTFLPAVGETELALAPASILPDIRALKASRRASDLEAARVLTRWTSATPTEALSRGVLPSVRRDLAAWLGTDAMKAVQDRLVARDLGAAYRLAQAWGRDTNTPVNARLLTYFQDLKTYSGDTGGIWVQHVRAYRRVHSDALSTLTDISSWLDVCAGVVRTEYNGKAIAPTYQRLYGVRHARRNVAHWLERVRTNPGVFDDATLDLIVFGYLRARQHAGRDPPHGFPGIYQADVFYRRSFVATGEGFFKEASAQAQPVDLYAWARNQAGAK